MFLIFYGNHISIVQYLYSETIVSVYIYLTIDIFFLINSFNNVKFNSGFDL